MQHTATPRTSLGLIAVACAAVALAGCASPPSAREAPAGTAAETATPAPAPTSSASPGSTAAAAPVATPASGPGAAAPRPGAPAARPPGAAAPTPPGPPPFATVIRDARRIDGPLTFWQKDDKLWIELLPAQFNQPFLLSPKIKSGIGEAFVLGGLMALPVRGAGGPQLVEFVRVHNQVRLQARNTDAVATPGTPEARALADAYSASLLGATAVASAPHPDRKSVLIEANGLFLSDMLGVGMQLQQAFRQGYSADRSNSVITAARASEQANVIETQLHFFSGGLAPSGPGAAPGAAPGAPASTLPRYVPDARSLLVTVNYSLAPLPATPMAGRRADPRVGLFTSTVLDFSSELSSSPRQRVVNRWRLEKKDPAAVLSEPVKPITFWIDRNVPLAYRDTVRDAILEWNKAFEKIGFKDALVVQQQPDDAAFDTLDFGYASVRWMLNAEPAFGAIGPSHVDPRSGEILDADIAFEGLSTRNVRGLRTQVLGASVATAGFATPYTLPGMPALDVHGRAIPGPGDDGNAHRWCAHGLLAAEQTGYALDVLQARGEIEPDSPQAQQFVLDYVKEAIMHEVGHALGLRHNFRASRVYSEAQLSDPAFTRVNGTTGSVMEYNAVNLPRPGQPAGTPFQTTLGPYDYWAVEYAYKPLPAPAAGATPEAARQAEREALQQIAARSSEPLLAFGTDEDNAVGLDPETLQLDLGNDPIAFAAKRLDIARDLFRRQETRELSPQRDYAVLRRSLDFALNDAGRALGVLARQFGGVRTLRDYPGSGRDPLSPVDATVQRQALDLFARFMLAPDGLNVSPALQRRLAPDYLDRAEALGQGTDYQMPQRLLGLQRAVLNFLLSDGLAARVLDSAAKFDRPQEAFALAEIHQRVARDVWSELDGSGAIAPARRELQRDHVNRLAGALLRPTPGARVDVRSLLREQARSLQARLAAAERHSATGKADAETRAHLADSADTLREALRAPLLRAGP